MPRAFFIFLVVFFVAGCSHKENTMATSKSRNLTNAKPSPMRKAGMNLNIQLKKEALSGDQRYKISAQVLPLVDKPQGQWQWKLPKHSKVISGLTQSHHFFVAQEVSQFEIIVEGLKSTDEIFFHAFEIMDGQRVGTPAMLTMKSAKTFEKSSAFKAKATSRFTKGKIFQ